MDQGLSGVKLGACQGREVVDLAGVMQATSYPPKPTSFPWLYIGSIAGADLRRSLDGQKDCMEEGKKFGTAAILWHSGDKIGLLV